MPSQPLEPLRPPEPVEPGGTLGIAASSSPLFGSRELASGLARLESAGYRIVMAPHAREQRAYLAGSPRQRAADLHTLWSDPSVDAVLQLRGGYGAAQVLPHLDWDLARRHPKPLIGFSDTTALHVALGRATTTQTLWGPPLARLGEATDYTWERFLRGLAGEFAPVVGGETFVGGSAEGPLVGGTTTLLAAGLGTPWAVDARGAILLLEDVDEEPYAIDRLLVQLGQAGVLRDAAAIVVGEHVRVAPRRHEPAFGGNSLSLAEVLADHVVPVGVPTVHGLPLGHGRDLATVPLGARARLDADAGELTILPR